MIVIELLGHAVGYILSEGYRCLGRDCKVGCR